MTVVKVIKSQPVIRVVQQTTSVRVTNRVTRVKVNEQNTIVKVGNTRTRVVKVVGLGPQGPQGPQGPIGPAGSSTLQGIAGEDISALRVVYFNASGAMVASAADFDELASAVGVALTAVTSGNTFNYQVGGKLEDSSWSWTPGATIFLSDAGTLSETPGTHLRIIGTALTTQSVNINFLHAIRR